MTIRKKIIRLFEYRQLPALLELAKPTNSTAGEFMERLIDLQTCIYDLDFVLESEWELLEDQLQPAWRKIYHALSMLDIVSAEYTNYCHDIYQYQKHELGQRQGKSLLRFDLEYFYYYKSCDVKLMRRLIYEKYPFLEETIEIGDWKIFDLITEIDDDIEDVYEDLGTNNGNRFLLSIEKYGVKETSMKYREYLENIGQNFQQIKNQKDVHPVIMEKTISCLASTIELLKLRTEEISENGFLSSIKSSANS